MTEFESVYHTNHTPKSSSPRSRGSAGRLLLIAVCTLIALSFLAHTAGRLVTKIRAGSAADHQRLTQIDQAMNDFLLESQQAYQTTMTSEEYLAQSRAALDEALERIGTLATGNTIHDHVARAFVEFQREQQDSFEPYFTLLSKTERANAFDPGSAQTRVQLQSFRSMLTELATLTEQQVERAKTFPSFVRSALEREGFSKREVDGVTAEIVSGMHRGGRVRAQELDARVCLLLVDTADLLMARWGSWEYLEDGVYFDDTEDADAYDELMNAIFEAIEEQEKLMQQS